MSGRGGDELASLITRTADIQRDDFNRDYRSFLRTVLVIFFMVVVASVIAIVVLWINKPPKPVVCDGWRSNSSGALLVFDSIYPLEPLTYLSRGENYRFSFRAVGSPKLQVKYRLCSMPFSNETIVCRNYTVSNTFVESSFADFFAGAVNCSETVLLSLEFLEFQPKPAVLMHCASSNDADYQTYCIDGLGGPFTEAGEEEEAPENPMNFWFAYVTNGSGTFSAAYSSFAANKSLEIGFCGQSYRKTLPKITYSSCWNTGFMNETCIPLTSGEQKNSDFFNGYFNFSNSYGSELFHYYVMANGTGTGIYVAVIRERPFIDSICNLK